MRKQTIIILSLLIMFFAWSAVVSSEQGSKNTLKGTLTVNGEIFQLKYIYTYQQDDELVIFMSDNPVAQENVPFDLGDIAYKGELHGFSVGISRSKRQLINDSPYHAIYHKIMLGRGAPNNAGTLTIITFDSNVLEARLLLDTPGTVYAHPEDHTYLYDVTLKVNFNIGKENSTESIEIIVTGDDSPAAKAYAAYYRAKLSGNIEELKKWVVKEHVKDLDSEMGKTMIRVSMITDPRKIDIVQSELSGDSALLIVKGITDDNTPATGNVKMIIEDGEWRVVIDKWDMTK
ncbi:hypothetical protein KAR48_17360 [bacterium]|nr:hypothetical protein [bacterium]